MSRLKLANRARKDLQEIHDFIAEDNEVGKARNRIVGVPYISLFEE